MEIRQVPRYGYHSFQVCHESQVRYPELGRGRRVGKRYPRAECLTRTSVDVVGLLRLRWLRLPMPRALISLAV